MATKHLKKSKQENKTNSVAELFSRPIKEVEENKQQPDFVELPDRTEDDLQLEGDENLSAFQIKVLY